MSEVAPSVGGGATSGGRRTADDGGETTATAFIRRVLQASRNLDPAGFQAQLDLAAAALGLAGSVDDVALPAMRQLADLLSVGLRDPGQDLMATESFRSWLNRRSSSAPPPREIGPILLACAPRDRQVVVLESLALLLRYRRWPCQVLGARISTFTLTIAARASGAIGVVILSTEGRGRQQAVVSLRAVEALGIPVFLAGDAVAPDDHLPQPPGGYLGTSIEGASTLIINALGSATATPIPLP